MKRSAHVWIYKVQALLALFINSLVYLRAAEPIHILTTTTDLASIVREIGGEYVQVQSLCSGNEDPHRLVPRPSHMVAAHQADAWIRVGMFIEVGYEQAILEGARNPRIAPGGPGYFNASEGVLRLEVPKGPVDRSMGDVHPAGNPHYMLDPLNGRIVAKRIARYLGQLRPEYASVFEERCRDFLYRLDCGMFGRELVERVGGARLWILLLKNELEPALKEQGVQQPGGWLGRLWDWRGRKVITYHKCWTYFLNRFGLIEAGTLEPKPGIPPSPGHLRRVLELISQEQIQIILQAPYFPRNAAEYIREHVPVEIVIAPVFPGGAEGVDDYLDVFDDVSLKLATAFKNAQSHLKR